MRLATFLAPGDEHLRSGHVHGDNLVSFEGASTGMLNSGEMLCLLKEPGSAVGPRDQIARYAFANDISARDAGDNWSIAVQPGDGMTGTAAGPEGPMVAEASEPIVDG